METREGGSWLRYKGGEVTIEKLPESKQAPEAIKVGGQKAKLPDHDMRRTKLKTEDGRPLYQRKNVDLEASRSYPPGGHRH